jgi:hypothetical protein
MCSTLVCLRVVAIIEALLVLTEAYGPSVGGPAIMPNRPEAIYFTGAGVYFFWQVGAAKYLLENSSKSMPQIVGASAGSLTGLMLLTGVDFDHAVEVALEKAEEKEVFTKPSGLRGELTGLLRDWMEAVLPRDIPSEVLDQLSIALTPPPTNPFKSEPPTLESGFTCREDVIDACLASCHIPWYSNGDPMESYRGTDFIDGSFWYFVTKNRFTGLPLPECDPEEILWVDYGDDPDFMASIGKESFLSSHSPSKVRRMVEYGYNYMKRAHHEGRLPCAGTDKPLEVPSMLDGISGADARAKRRDGPSQLEKERREWLRATKRAAEVELGDLTTGGIIMMQGGLSGGIADFTLVHVEKE